MTAREQLGLTQLELGTLLGITTVTISRWENGHTTPSPYYSALIAAFLQAAATSPSIIDEARLLLTTAGVPAALGRLLTAAASAPAPSPCCQSHTTRR